MTTLLAPSTLIRAARERAGLSQAALGRAVGRSMRTIRRLEAQSPDASVSLDLAFANALIVALGNPPEAAAIRAAARAEPVNRGRWAAPEPAGMTVPPPRVAPSASVRSGRSRTTRPASTVPPIPAPRATAPVQSVLAARYGGESSAAPLVSAPTGVVPRSDRAVPPGAARDGSLRAQRTRRLLQQIEGAAHGLEHGPIPPVVWGAATAVAVTALVGTLEGWGRESRQTALIAELALLAREHGEQLVRMSPAARQEALAWLQASGELEGVQAVAADLLAAWSLPEGLAAAVEDAVVRGMVAGARGPGRGGV